MAAVRDGRPASPDLEDGWRSLAVVDACERSSRAGGWVDVPEALP
jgi:predicted dehydrogenase